MFLSSDSVCQSYLANYQGLRIGRCCGGPRDIEDGFIGDRFGHRLRRPRISCLADIGLSEHHHTTMHTFVACCVKLILWSHFIRQLFQSCSVSLPSACCFIFVQQIIHWLIALLETLIIPFSIVIPYVWVEVIR